MTITSAPRPRLVFAAAFLLSACAAEAPAGAHDATPTTEPPHAETAYLAPALSADGSCPAGDAGCAGEVAELEEALARYEAVAEERIDPLGHGCWAEERASFGRALAACPDAACRERALVDRLATLDFLQPGASRLRRELPPVPALVALLGPAPDGAPAEEPAPPPLEARGLLVHASDHPEHMGIAVRPSEGAAHVFLLDAFVDPDAGQRDLLALLESRTPREVRVRGYARVAPTGIPNFDADRCRWVYLLP